MPYSAAALITDSYYLSGIVSRDEEVPSGGQLKVGLRLLNMLLAEKSITSKFIPYYTRIDEDTVINQEDYFVESLVNLQELTLTYNEIRYEMRYATRDQYFGLSRANNIKTIPQQYTYERENLGTRIYIYPKPDKVYQLNIMGKFALASVTYDEDLDDVLDKFYINYLMYGLAERICGDNRITFPPQSTIILKDYENAIRDLSPLDLVINKVSTLRRSTGLNWGDINIGRSLRPIP